MPLDWYVPITIAALPVLDWFFKWLKRFDQNCWEGDLLPPRCWISWGWVCYGRPREEFPTDLPRVGTSEVRDWRYILIRLPSFEWMPDYIGDRHRWMQRCLFYFRPRGWAVTFMRLTDG